MRSGREWNRITRERDSGPQNITKTFMHEGITERYRCYEALIEGDV